MKLFLALLVPFLISLTTHACPDQAAQTRTVTDQLTHVRAVATLACKNAGEACFGSDCCLGLYCDATRRCNAGVACRPSGSSCGSSYDCCTGLTCTTGRCR